MLEKLIKILKKYKNGIFAFYDEGMNNGRVEAVNKHIKTLNKIAYGLGDLFN